jgi:hypothetical protein
MSITVMKQALEALDRNWDGCVNSPEGEAITALKQALAAQRPLVWLSEEDEREIKDRCTTVACVLRAVKAKLKGKNT